MNSRATKSLIVLLAVAVVLCAAGSAFACESDDDCHSPIGNACHHCAAQCSCHMAGLPSFETGFSFDPADREHVPGVEAMKLPLVLESIIVPPKR